MRYNTQDVATPTGIATQSPLWKTSIGPPKNNRSNITPPRLSCASRLPAACPSNARLQTVSGASAAPVRTHCQKRSQLRMAVSLSQNKGEKQCHERPENKTQEV